VDLSEEPKVKTTRDVLIVSGGNGGEDPPVPIPNTEVKLSSAENTWGANPWEDRSPPDFL
jgi:hypothetical protein